MEPQVFALSNETAARSNLLAYATFSSFQTRDICSQQPGTLDMHLFWTHRSIKLFFFTIWSSNRFGRRLKNNFPSTVKRAIGRNSSIDSGLGKGGGGGWGGVSLEYKPQNQLSNVLAQLLVLIKWIKNF